MNETRVKSFNELHEAFKVFHGNSRSMFRGQGDASWPLVPRAGRMPFKEINDGYLFQEWKSEATQFIIEKPRTELEWLALAQHHGLATRLLDWSLNPLSAAFFAVWENGDTDAAVHAFTPCDILFADHSESPFKNANANNVFVWFPDATSPRIVRQQGVFTVHQPASTPMYFVQDKEESWRIIIDKEYRNVLREELSYYGITRSSLFPDLDGLASHYNWKIQIDLRNFKSKKNQK